MAGGANCRCMDGSPGRPGIDWKGAYDNAVEYGHRDAVSYQGGSYFRHSLAEKAAGFIPTNTTYWAPLALKGEDGGGGGATGPDAAQSTISIGSVESTTEPVTVQLKDADGVNLTSKTPVTYWLSSAPLGFAGGTVFSMQAPTGNVVKEHAQNFVEGMTDDTGLIVVNVTGLATDGIYFNIRAGFMLKTSDTTLTNTAGGGGD